MSHLRSYLLIHDNFLQNSDVRQTYTLNDRETELGLEILPDQERRLNIAVGVQESGTSSGSWPSTRQESPGRATRPNLTWPGTRTVSRGNIYHANWTFIFQWRPPLTRGQAGPSQWRSTGWQSGGSTWRARSGDQVKRKVFTNFLSAASDLQLVEGREADCEQWRVPGGERGVPRRLHRHPPDLQDSDARRGHVHTQGGEQERQRQGRPGPGGAGHLTRHRVRDAEERQPRVSMQPELQVKIFIVRFMFFNDCESVQIVHVISFTSRWDSPMSELFISELQSSVLRCRSPWTLLSRMD